jgi:hypothetical protein
VIVKKYSCLNDFKNEDGFVVDIPKEHLILLCSTLWFMGFCETFQSVQVLKQGY